MLRDVTQTVSSKCTTNDCMRQNENATTYINIYGVVHIIIAWIHGNVDRESTNGLGKLHF